MHKSNIKFQTIAMIAKHHSTAICSSAEEVYKLLSKKANVFVSPELARKLGVKKNILDLDKIDVDLAVSIGGDGTMLYVEKLVSGKRIPILGINCGALGFLAEVQGDPKPYVDRLFRGDFHVEERMKLDVLVNGKNIGDALNEVVIASAIPGKIQKFSIEIHGERIDEIAADGIILATPTGSTAYGLSAGGPIIDPTVGVYEIVPISPFKLSSRSLVVPADTKTKIRILSDRRDAILVFDGDEGPRITLKDTVEVIESHHKAYFIKFDDDFYKKTRAKLS